MILNERLPITPENLFQLIETLIDLDAEYHWLTRKELRVIRQEGQGVSNYVVGEPIELSTISHWGLRLEIMFYDDRIGNVSILPLTSDLSLVGVDLEPFKNENAEKIMRRLASGILLNVIDKNPSQLQRPIGQGINNIPLPPDTSGWTPEKRQQIDNACKKWAGRGYLPHYDMVEFLRSLDGEENVFLSEPIFKRCLRDAGTRGLIVKTNGRWRLP